MKVRLGTWWAFVALLLSVALGCSGETTETAAEDTDPPTVPSGLQARARSPSRIDLTWNASSDNVGVTTYLVYRDQQLIAERDGTFHGDAGLQQLTEYHYYVRARDAAGNHSDPSVEVAATTPSADMTAPTEPTGLTGIALGSDRIDLSWNPASDDVAVVAYRVLRAEYGGGALTHVGIALVTETSYSDTDVDPSTRYSYHVIARDAAGNESPLSNQVKKRTFSERFRWRFDTGNGIGSCLNLAAIGDDDTIYVTAGYWHGYTGEGSGGGVYALNPDGTLVWEHLVDVGLYTPIVTSNGTVYVQDRNSSLYAIDSDGESKWTFELDVPTKHVGEVTPAVGSDGTIYIGADTVYAITPSGSLDWKYTPGSNESIKNIRSSPAVAEDGTIYIGAIGGFGEDPGPTGAAALLALDSDGDLSWQYVLEAADFTFSSPAIGADGTIYIGAETATQSGRMGYLYAIKSDGTLRWRYDVSGKGRAIRGSPAIGADGTIYVGTAVGEFESPRVNGALLALKPDGTLKWSYTPVIPGDGEFDVHGAPTVGSDGTIYVSGETHSFYAVNPDGTAAWEFEMEIVEGSKLMSPFVAVGSDGTVYAGDGDGHLHAVDSDSEGLADSNWPKIHHGARNSGNESD